MIIDQDYINLLQSNFEEKFKVTTSLREILEDDPEFKDSPVDEMLRTHILNEIMPEVIEEFGDQLPLDVRFNTPYKDFAGIVEEVVDDVNFIKITKKGIKMVYTFPMEVLVQTENTWKLSREATL